MSTALFRFYSELNDFLSAAQRQVTFAHTFDARTSVKDMIESLGVPHTEIELILVKGTPVDFSYIVQDADQLSVYPIFETFDATPVVRLRPAPLRVACFVLDAHLGKLAGYLRLVGFDTLYRNNYDDETLAIVSSTEHRILLTRDRGLLKRSMVTHGYFVRQIDPKLQIVEVLHRFDLQGQITPFRRCIRCNGLLRVASKESIADQIPPHALQFYDEFHTCDQCGKVYWKGSHYQHLLDFVSSLARYEG
ncbi:MAG TPA: Mut7-C RNAse domain-containing protein [Anaerolineae bacterium]